MRVILKDYLGNKMKFFTKKAETYYTPGTLKEILKTYQRAKKAILAGKVVKQLKDAEVAGATITQKNLNRFVKAKHNVLMFEKHYKTTPEKMVGLADDMLRLITKKTKTPKQTHKRTPNNKN